MCKELKRAKSIPSTNKGRWEETQLVRAVLRDNNYPMFFIQNCESALTKQLAEKNFSGFVVLPNIKGVSEEIGCILKQQQVKVAYKPQLTINSLFPRHKELDYSDRQKSGIVYKISCTQCYFVYYGQPERSLKTLIAEHKKSSRRVWPKLQSCKRYPPFQLQHELWKRQGRWFRSKLPRANFPLSLALYFGPERLERSYRATRSLQRYRASMNYVIHASKLRATLL